MGDWDNYNSMEWRLNRSINYTIIKMMWDAINGGLGTSLVRGFEDDKTSLTGTFETSKYKWDSIVRGDIHSGFSKKMPKHLEEKTGIPQSVYTGAERIKLPDDSHNKSLEYHFGMIVGKSNPGNSFKETYKKTRPAIFQSFKTMQIDYDTNKTLYRLWYFIKFKEPLIISIKAESDLAQISDLLNRISIRQLEGVQLSHLNLYREALSKQYRLVNALIIYKESKAEEKASS